MTTETETGTAPRNIQRGPPATDDLGAVVVRYSDGPDRCTVVPRDAPPEATLSAWLTADLEAVVELEDVR